MASPWDHELGLSCACAISKEYALEAYKRVLVICGPGHNGYSAFQTVHSKRRWICRRAPSRHFRLPSHAVLSEEEPKRRGHEDDGYAAEAGHCLWSANHRCTALCVVFIFHAVRSREELAASYDLVVDAILGFSAHGALRAPYDAIIGAVNASSLPVVCIDIPSGWDVDEGDVREEGIRNADMLISLTAPKACARFFKGRFHYLGGRFVAPAVFTQFPVHLPPYSGCELCVRLPFPFCSTQCEAKCEANYSTNTAATERAA